MKIVLAEKVSPATLAVFEGESGWQIVTHDQIKNGLAAELADADALVVRSAVQVDEALLKAAPKLRVIGRAGVGVDNIDADAATRRRHRGDEYSRRQRHRGRRADHRADACLGPPTAARQRAAARRQMGKEVAAGNRAAGQATGHSRPGPRGSGGGATGQGLRHGAARS